MSRPKLQLALDCTNLSSALNYAKMLHDSVDILEAGTLLCCTYGMEAVRTLRQHYPTHFLVADLKVADAGLPLTDMAFSAGANRMTVICSAPIETMQKALSVAQQYHGDIQLELFGRWSYHDARAWRNIGIEQVIYHRGRDAQANGKAWERRDLDRMKMLSDLGLRLSITGGVEPADLATFKNIAVQTFIVGRALLDAPYPKLAAKAFHHSIEQIWH